MMRWSHSILVAGLLSLVGGIAPTSAQSVIDASEVCSDPMTDGERKRTIFRASGWSDADPASAPIDGIARVHIPTFTGGLPDFQARLDLAPELAGNLRRMIEQGAADLLTLNGHYIFILVDDTPTGLEHLTCLYASPPTDAIFTMMERYGTPDDETYPGYVVLRFDEQAFVMDPNRTYDMVSIWSRLDLPLSATDRLTDAYRLERIEAAPE